MKKTIWFLLLTLFVSLGSYQQVAAAPVITADLTNQSQTDGGVEIGFVTAYDDTSITVNESTFLLEGAAYVEDGIEVGDYVLVIGFAQGDTLYALIVEEIPDENGELSLVGPVDAISAESITVAGIDMIVNDDTTIEDDPQVGDIVQVEALVGAGTITALSVEVQADYGYFDNFAIAGVIEALSDDSVTIDGTLFTIDEETEIDGDLAVGAEVYLIASEEDDGSYKAVSIQVIVRQIFDTGTIDAFDDSSLTVDGDVYGLTDETIINGDLAVGATTFLVATDNNDGTFTATYVEVMPDAPPPPANTPVSAYGEVTAYTSDAITVDGVDFVISAETEIYGDVAVGDTAFVNGTQQDDGTIVADYIEVIPPFVPIDILAGEVSAVTDDSFEVMDETVLLTEDTLVDGMLADGSFALVVASNDGDVLTALEVYVIDLTIEGTVEAVSPTSITVDGQQFGIDQQTTMDGQIEIGSAVTVAYSEGSARAETTATARYIAPASVVAPTAVSMSGGATASLTLLPALLVAAAMLALGTLRLSQRD